MVQLSTRISVDHLKENLNYVLFVIYNKLFIFCLSVAQLATECFIVDSGGENGTFNYF